MTKSLRSDLRHALDAGAWAKEVLREKLDDAQGRILRSESKRGVLNCHRQWGKSTVMAARSAHRMIYRPPWFTVCIAPSGRQAAELRNKIESCVRRGLGIEPKGDGDNEISIVLPNGSRFVGLPDTEGRMRGFGAVNDLLIDEAARVKDDTYKAARPFVAAVDGSIWMMSTPWGKRGFFYRAASSNLPGWERIQVTAEESGRFSQEWLDEERDGDQGLGPLWFSQEYEGKFVDTSESMFSHDAVLDVITPDVRRLVL